MRNKYLVIFTTTILLILGSSLVIWMMSQVEIRLAEEALIKHDYRTASRSYARAARLSFWQADLWEKAGLASFSGSAYPEVIDYIGRARTLTEEGWLAFSLAHLYLGDSESASISFEKGLQRFPDSLALHAGLAEVYRKNEDWEAELRELQELVLLSPDDGHVRYRLGVLLMLTDPEEAQTQLSLASSLDPTFQPAVQTLITVLEDPSKQVDSSSRIALVGRALGLVGEWEFSRSAFERAVAQDPGDAEAWAWLGEARQQTGLDGRTELDRALQLNPTSAVIRGLRGLYWSRQDKPAQMLAEYLLAAEYDPQNPAWQAAVGDAFLRLGDLEAAFRAYENAAGLAPEDPTYWRLLALFCAENGVYVEEIGLPAAKKAVELSSQDPGSLDALGFVYYASGRFANAQQTLHEAAKLDPEYFPAQIHLALNYLAQGNRPVAREILANVLALDPEGPGGVEARQVLQDYFP
ncbi:MAG: tetratricopeptide repeat protein [Chloroflexi bacterium]|nr:tetratricopeptide repeat protein [Chloroflexota bacterium]